MFRQANQFRSDLMRVADDWKRLLAGIRWKDEEVINTSHFEHFDVKTETLNDVEQKYGNDSDDSEDNIALGQLKLGIYLAKNKFIIFFYLFLIYFNK